MLSRYSPFTAHSTVEWIKRETQNILWRRYLWCYVLCRQQNMHEHVQAYPAIQKRRMYCQSLKFILKQIAILYYGNWYSSH
jgi:hypothetical protein